MLVMFKQTCYNTKALRNEEILYKANWSSGQDDALSRRKPGFDSRIGHGRQNNSLFCFCNNARCFRGAAGSAPHS